MWLKRSTPQNIVIGGAAGALPPIVGYAAATGEISLASIALFAIIFVWTPPHFWALALVKSEEYGRAGIPMLPNVKGADRTRRDILLYTLVLVPLGLTPWLIGFASLGYGLIAVVLGAVMLVLAARVYWFRTGSESQSMRDANVWLLDPLSFPAFRGDRRRTARRPLGRESGHGDAMKMESKLPGVVLTPEQQKARRQRNVAIGLAIALLRSSCSMSSRSPSLVRACSTGRCDRPRDVNREAVNPSPALSFRRKRLIAALAGAAALPCSAFPLPRCPLYRLFCAATGYAGTTQVAKVAPATTGTSGFHRPIRCECRSRTGLEICAGNAGNKAADRRDRDHLLQGHEYVGARYGGAGHVQRQPR